MKIALCLSGQPRGLPLCLEWMKSALDLSNMDIFCHTWFDAATIGQPFDSAQSHQTGTVGKVHPQTKELILGLNPVECYMEPQRQFPFARQFKSLPEANQERMASMFYSIYTANMMKRKYELEHDFIYDLVVRARYDLFYRNPIDVTKYVDLAKTGIVTAEKFQGLRNDPLYIHGNYTMTDIFAISTSKHMDIFSSTYVNMPYINTQINPPYGENYLGYRVRTMAELPVYGMLEFDYEIGHRVTDLNVVE